MVAYVDCSAATSYGSPTSSKRLLEVLSPDPVDDFSGGLQIMGNDLTQRVVCGVAGYPIVAARIAEKRWTQHM